MEARAGLGLRIGFLAASSLVLFGCPNPNTYTTPRTIGSGHFQHSLAAEAWGFSIPATTAYNQSETLRGTFPTLPTYTLRIGIGDSWEIGARISNMTSLGADLKWNFLKSSGIDLAIDPAFQIFQISVDDSGGTSSTVRVSYVHVPLLVGINLSRTVSLVLTPGLTWGFISGTATNTTSGTDQASLSSGALGRLGLGGDFRITPGFALHPEITFLRAFGTQADGIITYMFGIGFNFGAMPNYDDVGGGPPPIPPPAAPPPGYYPPPPGGEPPPPAGEPPAEPAPPPTM